jgi:hypothetical protein
VLLGIAGAVELIVLAACVTAEISSQGSRWDRTRRHATPEAFMIEVIERLAIARPYKAIGVVQATAPRGEHGPTDAEMLAALKKEARKLGGDAITELVKDPASTPEWWGPVPFAARRLHEVHWAALVIVWQQ